MDSFMSLVLHHYPGSLLRKRVSELLIIFFFAIKKILPGATFPF
jgi:hypothetical protein